MEYWEKQLFAATIYFVEPKPDEEVIKVMEKLVNREEAER